MTLGLVLTCEHAANRVPPEYRALFRSAEARSLLASHRGFDLGALAVAELCSKALATELYATHVTRLLVEANRSLHHPRLFSSFTRTLSESERARIIERYYTPHRAQVEAVLRAKLKKHPRVLHVAVHSFTPELDGKVRNAEIGLLYDPRRHEEQRLAKRWHSLLSAFGPYRVRRNYPYHGASDGFTTHLRRLFGTRYLGFELELNQRILLLSAEERRSLAQLISESIRALSS
jgi:predicted N-formylglutamate amidohydrolase